MASGTITKPFGKSSKSYTGTTDEYGNLEIPATIIDAYNVFAVPLYDTGGYISGTTFDSWKIVAKLLRYDGNPLSNTRVTVYFLT